MHTGQIILVEGEDQDDALALADYFATGEGHPDWSDWAEVGGRWAEFLDGKTAIRYSDDPATAEKFIAHAVLTQTETVANLQRTAADILSMDYDPYAPYEYDTARYNASMLSRFLSGTWTPEHGIYDAVDWSTSLAAFKYRVAAEPDKQWLVMVDFHF